MVGAHHGLIEGNYLKNDDSRGNNGVMAKGSSLDVLIIKNQLMHAGRNAVQIGGGGDASNSRPDTSGGYSAKEIYVERNVIVGSEAAVAFENSDTSFVRLNSIYKPTKWLFRILKPITIDGFFDTRNGTIERNIIVWDSTLKTHLNIGPNTAPETFQFIENWWYNLSNPADTPVLPSVEQNGVYGIDPQYIRPGGGNLHLKTGSLALSYGAYAP